MDDIKTKVITDDKDTRYRDKKVASNPGYITSMKTSKAFPKGCGVWYVDNKQG